MMGRDLFAWESALPINREKQLVPVAQPSKGVNTVVNREGQPPDTCWNALNMVPYDRWGRKRVAQRPGLQRSFPGFTGLSFIQNLTSINNINYNSGGAFSAPAFNTSSTNTFAQSAFQYALNGVETTFTIPFTILLRSSGSTDNNSYLEIDMLQPDGVTGIIIDFLYVQASYNFNPTGPVYTHVLSAGVNSNSNVINAASTVTTVGANYNVSGTATITLNPAAQTITGTTTLAGSATPTTTVSAVIPELVTFNLIESVNGTGSASTVSVGAITATPTNASPVKVSAYNTTLVAVSDGFVYSGTTVLQKAANQSSAPLLANVPVASARVFNEVFFVDGQNLAQLDIPSNTMIPYVATNGSTPNSTTSTGSYVLSALARSGGTATAITTSTNGFQIGDTVTIANVTTAGWNGSYAVTNIVSATSFQFVIGGTPTTPATLTGSSSASGPYRLGSTTCSLACTWRGRMVLAGDSGSPQNFYMSRAGNAFDWNYGAIDAQAAVAGNLSTSGSIGEPITALIPFSDDIMMIGCTHSIWLLQGDPAQNGTIVPVSSNVGVVGANGWTKDSFDSLYFLGTDGLYKCRPLWEQWQPPQLLTGTNLDQYFAGLQTSQNIFTMIWHEDAHYLHLFVTPADDVTAGTHLIWDTRGEGLWPQQYPQAAGPTAAILWYANGDPLNRGVLVGGWDGVIRRLDQTALDDTGFTINATLTFGPFHPFPEAALLSAVTIDLGEILTSQVGDPPIAVADEVPSGVTDGSNTSFQLANQPVLIDTVYLFANGGVPLNQGPFGDYTIDSTGLITFGFPPPSGTVLTANYTYQQSPASPANVLMTMATGADAYSVTENLTQTEPDQPRVASIACIIDRRQKTMRQRLRGGWFSFTLSNQNQPDTYFSFESALMEFQDAGRNRLRR